MIDYSGKKILITGAYGFLGQHLIQELLRNGAEERLLKVWDHQRHDLININNYSHFTGYGPFDYVFHLAGYNGNIQFNLSDGADIFYRSTVMGLNLLDWAAKTKAGKVISMVASCGYPEYIPNATMACPCGVCEDCEMQVCNEHYYFSGPCNPTVECHGYAKRNLQLASKLYWKQYNLNAVCLCPCTLYGPGDSFDPKKTKVMGGLIKKFSDAARDKTDVTLWGTGTPMREFLYVEDAAKLIVEAGIKYEGHNIPLNIGSGQEISIKELANYIALATKFMGKINWDTTKPDGQYRKRLDLTEMQKILTPQPFMPLYDGIIKTVEYYREIQ